MKPVVVALAVYMLAPSAAHAQCAADPKETIGGYTQQRTAAATPGSQFAKASLPAIETHLTRLAALVQEALPRPKGASLKWSTVPLRYHDITPQQPSYHSIWYVQPYGCSPKTRTVVPFPTPLMPIIAVNGIDKEILKPLRPADDPAKAPGRARYLALPALQPQSRGQVKFYRNIHTCNHRSAAGDLVDCGQYLALVHPSGREPLIAVTREQYMDWLIDDTQAQLAATPDVPYELVNHSRFPTRESWDADVRRRRAEQNVPAQQLMAFRDGMTSAERQAPAVLADFGRFGSIAFDHIEFLRHASNGRNPFTTPDQGFQIVTVNPAFFDPKLPAHVPQFISIGWTFSEDRLELMQFNDAMLERFDFEKVIAMLGR